MRQHNDRLQIRVDAKLKRRADKIFTKLGLDTASAIRLFLTQTVIQNGLPFGLMNLDASPETCTNKVTRELLVSDGRAYELWRTQQTCALASPRSAKAALQPPKTPKLAHPTHS